MPNVTLALAHMIGDEVRKKICPEMLGVVDAFTVAGNESKVRYSVNWADGTTTWAYGFELLTKNAKTPIGFR